MKRITVPGKTSPNGSDKIPAKNRPAEGRNVEGQRRFRAMQTSLRNIVSEMKRVTWPSREEWISATLVTIGLVVIVALWTTLVSWIAGILFGGSGQ